VDEIKEMVATVSTASAESAQTDNHLSTKTRTRELTLRIMDAPEKMTGRSYGARRTGQCGGITLVQRLQGITVDLTKKLITSFSRHEHVALRPHGSASLLRSVR